MSDDAAAMSLPGRVMRRDLVSALVLAALSLLTSGALASTGYGAKPPDVPPPSFYRIPSSVPAQPPGTVFRSLRLNSPASFKTWVVLYHSRSAAGKDVLVSGVVVVPGRRPPAGGFALVSFAHGTTGFTDAAAPSKSGDTGTPLSIYHLIQLFVFRGYALALTDYEGLGTPGPLQYNVGLSAGRSVLDIARAARNVSQRAVADRLLVAGHSEGGHAALWAGQLAASYAPELRLRGVIASAPGANLPAFWRLRTYSSETTLNVLGLLGAWHRIYDAPLNPLLTAAGLRAATQVVNDHRDRADLSNPVFKPHPLTGNWLRLARRNTPGATRTAAPILLFIGTADKQVPPATNFELVKTLKRVGDNVRLRVLKGADHDQTLIDAKGEVLSFLQARLR